MKDSIKNTVIEEVVAICLNGRPLWLKKALDRIDLSSGQNEAMQNLDWNLIQTRIAKEANQALLPAKCLAVGIGFGFGVFQALVLWFL